MPINVITNIDYIQENVHFFKNMQLWNTIFFYVIHKICVMTT